MPLPVIASLHRWCCGTERSQKRKESQVSPGLSAYSQRQEFRFGSKALRSCLIVCLVGILLPYVAHAASVVWVLNGINFDDGGTASGTFTYDPVTNLYTNVNITTT